MACLAVGSPTLHVQKIDIPRKLQLLASDTCEFDLRCAELAAARFFFWIFQKNLVNASHDAAWNRQNPRKIPEKTGDILARAT
jgi:hypothetical protein